MFLHGFDGGLVAGLPGGKTVSVLEGVLRRDHQVHAVEPGFLGEVPHDGQVPFVQGIERPAVNRYLHNGAKILKK